MEFTVNKTHFLDALSDIRKVISSSSLIPVTSGISIIAKEDRLTLVGTNLDFFIQRDIPVKIGDQQIVSIQKTGIVYVPSKAFTEIVKRLPDQISVTVNDDRFINIESESINTRLNQVRLEEFPDIPDAPTHVRLKMNSAQLVEVIKQTSFAVSTNQSRPALTGIHVSFTTEKLLAVATNSIRLAMRSLPIQSDCEISCIIPQSTLTEFLKLSSSFCEHLEISISDHHILFEAEDIKLYSRLIGGDYPSTSGLIPSETTTEIIMDTKELLKGIDRSYILASDKQNNNVTLKLSEEDDQIQISSLSSEVGQICEWQSVKQITGEKALDITFDGQYIIDALKTMNDQEVSISFNGSMRPILIKPANREDQLHLISPVRS
ncbi:DNA polymerase III subunit beta [Pseudalkalibacillus berkeleyi]|uniref:Beta sliding clamp n=1 Tax=Pseudalkalibacillus berkeleyi TaxID=1069813 RepID=A0ABS9GXL2_9BACL|nr:DNA polymerase III subunit beta [Pseudalkalibacillus berkeleyi]MCF6136425.1 DNA polymerase III subunit beta [Pseudalkalibacillus berkeleyi]